MQTPCKVLFTSRSSSGAWQIRGTQVAKTHPDWVASNEPSLSEISRADIVCVVKRTRKDLIEHCRDEKKLIVLDVVDFWPQPRDVATPLGARASREQVLDGIEKINPDALIFPNRAMWSDFHKYFSRLPTTFIYHHYRPEFDTSAVKAPNTRPTVAYEGGDYLGEWRESIQRAAQRLNAEFLYNPDSLLEVDVVVNARSKQFQTYLNRNYKSNVKAVNALGAFKPLVCHAAERSAHEIDPGSFLFFSDERTLNKQLELALYNLDFRKQNLAFMRKIRSRFSISTISTEFEMFFESVIGWYRAFPRFNSR